MRTPLVLLLTLVLIPSCLTAAGAQEISALVAKLKDKNPRESAKAAEALAALGKDAEPAIPDLIEALADDRDADDIPLFVPAPRRTVGSFASDALVAIGASATENLIIELNDYREPVRYLAMETLARIGKPAGAALPKLKESAKQEEEPGLRLAALDAYTRIAAGTRASVTLLTHALIDASPDVRGFAARELGDIGAAASAAVPLLRRRLHDTEYRYHWISSDSAIQRLVRRDAAEALGKIGIASQQTTDALTDRMLHDDAAEMRVSAALALLRLDNGNRAAMDALIAALENRGARSAAVVDAADALAHLGPKAEPAFEALTKALNADNEFTRMGVARAIAAIGGEKAVAALMPLLNDENAQVRETAAECLGKLGPCQLRPPHS